MRKLWFPILIGLLLTAALFPLGMVFSKSGGESFSIIFFPYTSLLGLALPNASGSFAVVLGYALFLLQYPIYCIILKLALDRGKFYQRLVSLLGLHILFVFICFAIFRRWSVACVASPWSILSKRRSPDKCEWCSWWHHSSLECVSAVVFAWGCSSWLLRSLGCRGNQK